MPDSVSEDIEREFLLLLEKEKYIEARQVIRRIKKKSNLSNEDKLLILYLKGSLNYHRGHIGSLLKNANKLYEESKKNKIHKWTVDALNFKFQCVMFDPISSWDELWEFILEAEETLRLIPKENQNDTEPRKAVINFYKGFYHYNRGDLNLAIKALRNSLELSKQIKNMAYLIPSVLNQMGFVFSAKGELETALKVCNETLQFIKESVSPYRYRGILANTYRCLGNTLYRQGKLDLAIENYEKVLEIQWTGAVSIPWTCLSLVQLYLDKNSPKKAEEYLERLKEFQAQNYYPVIKLYIQLSRARILKFNKRIQNLAESEKILKQLIEQATFTLVFRIFIIVELCDLLLIELQITDDIEILDEIDTFISQLLKIAEKQHSFSALAQARLLQGKLALIRMNLGDARRFLIQAQQMADEHGLQVLAQAISKEHDKLLGQLDIWENLNKIKAPISERLKLASIDETFDHLLEKRVLKTPELIEEEPISLLIMDRGGNTYFNHSFIENWDFSDLFSAFMSAFNSFSSEVFSKSIDRIKIDENVILMKPIKMFLLCYVIKGQSYPAQQKLARFSDAIKDNPEIWKALEKSALTNEMLELNKPPSLGIIINEIFA